MENGILDPVVLLFFLGLISGLAKTDLKFPREATELLSLYLLLALGVQSGIGLRGGGMEGFGMPSLGVIALGLVVPYASYHLLHKWGGFSGVDSAAIAVHYGSVSAVTFAVAQHVLERLGVVSEPFMPVLMILLGAVAISAGLGVARLEHATENIHVWAALREVLLGKGLLLLLGGMAIGWVNGLGRIPSVDLLFVGAFKGALALYMLGMGSLAAENLRSLRTAGWFLVAFAIWLPWVAGVTGIVVGRLCGLELGGGILLGVLASSASHIAAPAAIRVALPEASPSNSLVPTIGITFSFNVLIGIPLYCKAGELIYGLFR